VLALSTLAVPFFCDISAADIGSVAEAVLAAVETIS
jgi:hypothetical protein